MIDEAGGTANVFGHSSGAVLALEAARLLPSGKISKLALYGPPFIVDESRPPTKAHAYFSSTSTTSFPFVRFSSIYR